MGLKDWKIGICFLLICFNLFSGCGGGKGTEVPSPPNPNETPGPRRIDDTLFSVTFDLLPGWSYKEYEENSPRDPADFQDSDSRTKTVAQFKKGTLGLFTIFYSVLDSQQTLRQFIELRYPGGNPDIQRVEEDGQVAYVGIMGSPTTGPRGGSVLDIYFNVEDAILWTRGEVTGSNDNKNTTVDEFSRIISSMQLTIK